MTGANKPEEGRGDSDWAPGHTASRFFSWGPVLLLVVDSIHFSTSQSVFSLGALLLNQRSTNAAEPTKVKLRLGKGSEIHQSTGRLILNSKKTFAVSELGLDCMSRRSLFPSLVGVRNALHMGSLMLSTVVCMTFPTVNGSGLQSHHF
eukprot:1359221-Rhodomonas_salina.1